MKQRLQFFLQASAALLLAVSALAEDPLRPTPGHADYTKHSQAQTRRANQLNGAAKASELLGVTVKNYQDQKLGKVEDFAVDLESGRVVQVIVSTGGFLGVGDTLTALPPGALHHDTIKKVLHLDADKEKLKGSPKFDNAKWDESTQPNRVTEVYAYYGVQPYFGVNRDGSGADGTQANPSTFKAHNTAENLNRDEAKTLEKERTSEIARKSGEYRAGKSTLNPDGVQTRKHESNENETNATRSNLGYVQMASKLIGTSVKNLQDEKLGDVKDLLFDLASGRIVAVIVSSGGFLGMGNELSAVPPTALRYTSNREILQLDVSKEMLTSAPHFKATQWPDFSQQHYASDVYRAYNVNP